MASSRRSFLGDSWRPRPPRESGTPSSDSNTNITSASLPYPCSPPTDRPIPMTASRAAARRCGRTRPCGWPLERRPRASRPPRRTTPPDLATSSRPSRSPRRSGAAPRRTPRAAATATSQSSLRRATASISPPSTSRPRGRSSASSASKRHRFGRPAQQVGDVAAGGEHSSQPSRGRRLSSRSTRRYQGVLPSASLTCRNDEQPGVGVRRVGEPAEHRRQQRPLDRAHCDSRPTSAPRGGGARAAGSEKPSASSRSRAASGVRLRVLDRQPRDRVEQRPVEQLLVQPADLARVTVVLAAPFGGVTEAHRPRRASAARLRSLGAGGYAAGAATAGGARRCARNRYAAASRAASSRPT